MAALAMARWRAAPARLLFHEPTAPWTWNRLAREFRRCFYSCSEQPSTRDVPWKIFLS